MLRLGIHGMVFECYMFRESVGVKLGIEIKFIFLSKGVFARFGVSQFMIVSTTP